MIDSEYEFRSGKTVFTKKLLFSQINEILMRYSKCSEVGQYWQHDNRRKQNRNNKHQNKNRNHNRSHSQSYNQSNWPKKEFVNGSYFGHPTEFEHKDRSNNWDKNERLNDSDSEKVRNNRSGSNNLPANSNSGNSTVLNKNVSAILPSPISFNNDDVTGQVSKSCTYAQAASKPPCGALSMEDLVNIPDSGLLATPLIGDIGMASKNLGDRTVSGGISDWMSAGTGRTWRRRKQNQENYFSGQPASDSKGGPPGFGPKEEGGFGRGRMKKFNSNLSLNTGTDNSWLSYDNESSPGSKNEDQGIQNRSSGRRLVDSHCEIYSDSSSNNNKVNNSKNNGNKFVKIETNKSQNSYHNHDQTSFGQLKGNRYGSMHNLNSYN